MVRTLNYHPFPKQQLFHSSPARFRLFGGAAGPGKTEAILMEAVIQCLEAQKTKPIDGALFRRTFPELEMSLVQRFLAKVPNEFYDYNQTTHKATFRNGSTLRFCFCDAPNDVYKYQSAEFDFIGVDELTHFDEHFFTYIISRMRTTKKGVFVNFFAGTNPGNIGHVWVKQRWIDKNSKAENYKPEEYDFIPALVEDNPILMKNDPDYVSRLRALPEEERKQLLDGNFDVFQGQFFREWDPKVHVEEAIDIPDSWAKFRSIDISGRNGITSCHWYAVDNDGVVHAYREHYASGLDNDQHAKRIAELSRIEDAFGNAVGEEEYKYTVIDSAAFAKMGYPETTAEVYNRFGVNNLVPSPKNREMGWDTMHRYLRTGKFKVSRECVNMIRTFPTLLADSHNPNDVDTRGEDHAQDEARYLLQTLRDQGVPKPVSYAQRVLEERKKRNEGYDFSYVRFT